jgi:hypothetical protein
VTSQARRRRPIVPLIVAFGGVAFLTGAAVVASVLGSAEARWVPVGTVEDVNSRGVVFLRDFHAYVVAQTPGNPITLIAKSTHLGEPVGYCATSRWFEDAAHGAKFDRLGRYALGLAPRGLDRLPTTVRDGLVLVDPTRILLGPARPSSGLIPPAGPFCV